MPAGGLPGCMRSTHRLLLTGSCSLQLCIAQTTPPQFCQSACTAYHVCKAAMRKVGQCPLKKEKPMLQAPALQGARRNGDELM